MTLTEAIRRIYAEYLEDDPTTDAVSVAAVVRQEINEAEITMWEETTPDLFDPETFESYRLVIRATDAEITSALAGL